MEKLKCSLSSYSSVNSPLKNVMADIDRDLQCKFSNSPTACLEKQTAMPDLNEGQKSLFNMNSNGNENSINTSMLSQVNETTDRDKVEEPQHSMFTYTPLKDAYGTRRNAVVSPSQLSLSGSKMTQHLMSPTEGALISSGTDSLLAGEQEDNPPHLQIESEKNFQSPSRGAVILNSPDKSIQGGAEPMHSKPYVCSSTTEPYLHSPSSKESAENPSMKGPIQSPPQENPTLNSTGRKAIQSSLRKAPSQSPCRKESTLSPPRKELTQSPGKEPIRSPFVKELTRSPIVRDPIRSPTVKEPIRSPFIKDMNRIPSRKESTNSPSRLDLSCAADTENVQPFAGKDLVYHESNSNSHPSDGCYQGLHISQNPFTGKDSENSVGQKRQNLGIISEDGYCTNTIPRIQKSPKVPRIENCNPEFMLHQSNKRYDDRQKCGGDTTWQCWTDLCTISCFVLVHLNSQVLWQICYFLQISFLQILVKFSGDTESRLASKLNLRAKFDCLNVGHKRVAEARLLLYKIVYEKAKLHLMQVKREK
nr:peptidyl-prolyl cis-trans isomerase CYP95-like isoform X3 [Malus domestica]XP_028963934.1 peptidyl-prolyl cis-trans isomerase CYP95-like isoform X3 [Malus domestica]